MKKEISDKVRINHILDAITEIELYISNSTFDDFKRNSMMHFACIKQLEIIGEATNHISDTIQQSYPDLQWREIIGLRNILVHDYFGVDVNVIWNIVKKDIPVFKIKIEKIYNSLVP